MLHAMVGLTQPEPLLSRTRCYTRWWD
jgi:hypothetical protein